MERGQIEERNGVRKVGRKETDKRRGYGERGQFGRGKNGGSTRGWIKKDTKQGWETEERGAKRGKGAATSGKGMGEGKKEKAKTKGGGGRTDEKKG